LAVVPRPQALESSDRELFPATAQLVRFWSSFFLTPRFEPDAPKLPDIFFQSIFYKGTLFSETKKSLQRWGAGAACAGRTEALR
jgi:hypothetical protein